MQRGRDETATNCACHVADACAAGWLQLWAGRAYLWHDSVPLRRVLPLTKKLFHQGSTKRAKQIPIPTEVVLEHGTGDEGAAPVPFSCSAITPSLSAGCRRRTQPRRAAVR